MIGRAVCRCSTTRALKCAKPWSFPATARRFSTASRIPISNDPSPLSLLGAFTSELDKIAPRFDLHGSQVQILRTPDEFYTTLKAKIQNAERRIFLATLYIGKTEHELISVLRDTLRAKPSLKLSILTDALRGTRESPNTSCASLLAPLIAEFGADRVDIRMYHTPNLTGLRKKYVPRRINEGWGLQHMKLYGIDDEIILSGANLSSDYFTNRQDRYHVFSSQAITEYFWKIYDGVSQLSFLLSPEPENEAGFVLTWPNTNQAPSPLDDPAGYVKSATNRLGPLLKPTSSIYVKDADTSVYVLSQLTQLLRPDTSTEHPAISTILKILSSNLFADSKWMFTAGYFNPEPALTRLLINTASSQGTVVTASPWANGFYGSKGVSGLLPPAYTLLSRRFLESVERAGRSSAISLKEWRNGTVGTPGGWTYHAKGIWITMPKDGSPSITLIGSSNYTKRAYSLDLEANALIVSKNGDLNKRMGEEQSWLQEHAKEVGIDDFAQIDRRVSLKVRIAMWIVSLVGGAL